MNRLFIYILSILMCINAYAQDSVVQKTPAKGINAMKYALQNNYRGQDTIFSNKRFFDNMFFQAGVSVEQFILTDTDFDPGTGVSFGIGKYVTPLQSLRLTYDMVRHERRLGSSLQRNTVSLAHLYNFSGLILGYNPNRRFELSTIAGAGFTRASLDDETKNGLRAFFGLQGKFHATSHFDLSVEPMFAFSGMNTTFMPENSRNYTLSYGVGVNGRYLMHNAKYRPSAQANHLVYGNFYAVSLGAQMPLDNLEGWAPGPALSLSFGRWIVPGLGMRLTGSMATHTWHQANYSDGYKCFENTSNVSGRGEFVVNPITLFRRFDKQDKVQFRLSSGLEIGYMSKQNYYKHFQKGYYGYTGGLQLGFLTESEKFIYIGAQYTQALYRMRYENLNAHERFADNVLNINLGMEIGEPIVSRKTANNYMKPNFRKRFLLSVEAGTTHPIQTRRYADGAFMSYEAGILAQIMLSPVHNTAVHFDISQIITDSSEGNRELNVISTALQYRFDATNAILGYDALRRVSLELYGGPVLSLTYNGNSDQRVAFGAETGISAKYNIRENLGLYIAPQLRLYPSGFFPEATAGWNKTTSIAMGLMFKL